MGLTHQHRFIAGDREEMNEPHQRRNRYDGNLTQTQAETVVGSTQLYTADGRRRCVPMPTPDPTDPLNLPQWRKWAAVTALCFYGALTAAAESIIGALLPVFILEYAGEDPRKLGTGELTFDSEIEGGPPTWQTALLATLPILINGIVSFCFVPISIAVGRRPVILLCGALSFIGGTWAALSTSLNSHIGARCFQAIGGGTIDSLIPLIISDFMFIHERNKAVAAVNASTGFIIVALGIGSPLIVTRASWRWVYGMTSIISFATWVGIVLLLPETRRIRSAEELAGQEVYPLREGELRPQLDYQRYGRRTKWVEFGIFNAGYEWKRALHSVWLAIKALSFPNLLWCICLNATTNGSFGAVQQLASSVLLSNGWMFESLGFFVVPIVVASPFIWLFGGYIADKVSNALARRRNGHREPEYHLLNLLFPILVGFAGNLIFGYTAEAAENGTIQAWFVLWGVFMLSFTSSTVQGQVAVYLVESYPIYAGPVLVTSSTFRLVVSFLWNFQASTWVEEMGYFKTFSIYAGSIMGIALLLPAVVFFGKRLRNWSVGRLDQVSARQNSTDSANAKKAQVEYSEFASPASSRRVSDPNYDLSITRTNTGPGQNPYGRAV